MNRVAIAFSTKDRTELSKRTVEPLLQPDKFDLWWMDGSDTEEGRNLWRRGGSYIAASDFYVRNNVRGGADATIVSSLTELLSKDMGNGARYDYVGLVENDVLLQVDWYKKTMELFEIGKRDGLRVGAVSARCYEDRILIQRPDYAIMHNVGAGMVIFTREAAELILKHFRTGRTNVNRLLFSQLSGIDIGSYWAFRGGLHACTSDWHWDTVLAAHGLAVCALTPSPVEMIGQVPPLADQGLTLATGPVADRVNDEAFKRFRDRTSDIRNRVMQPAWPGVFHSDGGINTIFPHQLQYLGGSYTGDWLLKWMQGFGPFAWKASQEQFWERPGGRPTGGIFPRLTVSVLGSCDFLIGGGKNGGIVKVVDKHSGFEATPNLQPEGEQTQVLALTVPSAANYREIELTALDPGVCFYGIRCREPQPYNPALSFDHSWLPPCG